MSTTSSLPKSAARSSLHQHQQEHLDTSRPTGDEVTSICVVNKGFFCLIGGKRLCLYTKIGDSWDFAKTREYVVPNNDLATTRSSSTNVTPSTVSADKQQQLNLGQAMWKVAVSPAEEHVLVLTSKQQIYAVSDIGKDQAMESRVSHWPIDEDPNLFALLQEPFVLELIFHSFHQSAIRGIDVAVQKPLFVSSGDDQTVRLWNYQSMVIEQMRAYLEPVYAISLHPSGHQMVVAFASKVSLMNILIDGFYVVKEFPIHAAHDVRFSHGGHLFAVVDANIVQVISPIHQRVLHRLNHGQTVRLRSEICS